LAARKPTAEQAGQLASVHLKLHFGLSNRETLALLVESIRGTLGEPAALFVLRRNAWTLESAAPVESPIPAAAEFGSALSDAVAAPPDVIEWSSGDDSWTLVGCHTHPAVVIAIGGAWASSPAPFLLMANNLALIWRARRNAARSRSRLAAHRLAQKLSKSSGMQQVHEAIIDSMARSVKARIAALAVPNPADHRLSIVATRGYALELVEHLRIESRSGILGAVYQSGRSIHVEDAGAFPDSRRPRPRYRTGSFIGVPIRTSREVLGVVCVTDRFDDQPFTVEDVGTLRALAVPAALALGRERAVVQAENFAMTAAIDPLSGAFNRRHFHIRLEEELQRSRRHNLSLAFLMIDIDDFKHVNDSYGHLAGDTVIRDVAEILRRSVRLFDLCARFGGEEFAIIMPGGVLDGATAVAERIRERIEAYRPADRTLEQLRLTASIGLAVSSNDSTGRELIARADQALYMAKRAGKNCVRVAELELPAEPPHGSVPPDWPTGA
jgi:diguanylate cyclase (GGDEF)-like protein